MDVVEVDDSTPSSGRRFTAPGLVSAAGPGQRDVVEGGQLLGAALVAAGRAVPAQRVVQASMSFVSPARFSEPTTIDLDPVRTGRSFSTFQSATSQSGKARAAATIMMAASATSPVTHSARMPAVAPPDDCPLLDFGVQGRELRVVDGNYNPDPALLGPPELHVWSRFDHDPGDQGLRLALTVQSITHWTIAAGFLPHVGYGEAMAHDTLSTGVINASVSVANDSDVTDWNLTSTTNVWAGQGMSHGTGTIYSQSGRLIATFSVQAMVRPFSRPPTEQGLDSSTIM